MHESTSPNGCTSKTTNPGQLSRRQRSADLCVPTRTPAHAGMRPEPLRLRLCARVRQRLSARISVHD
eukprot:3736531-Pleurochrysis_carterae.AAC.1